MAYYARIRQPGEALVRLAVGRFNSASPETHYILAAADSSVHLYAIEFLGTEEVLVRVSSLNLFGHIVQVGCLEGDQGDLALALLATGQLVLLDFSNTRLRVLRWITALEDQTNDPAAFLAIHDGFVAVGSMFGRVALLHAGPSTHSTTGGQSALTLYTGPCINLKDQGDAQLMPSRNERVVSIHLTSLPDWASHDAADFEVLIWFGMESAAPSRAFWRLEASFAAALAWPSDSATSTISPSESLRIKWYRPHLPGIVTPMPAPNSGFFTTIERCSTDQLAQVCAVCTTADCTSTRSPPYDNLRRIILGSWSTSLSSCFWDTSNSDEPVLIAACTNGEIFRVRTEEVATDNAQRPQHDLICMVEAQAEDGRPPLHLPTWEPALSHRGERSTPFIVPSCGSVEGKVIDMATLPGGRLICLTEQHALVLLQLQPITSEQDATIDYQLTDSPRCALPTYRYTPVHCLQGAGPLTAAVRSLSGSGEMVTAVRSGPLILSHEVSNDGSFPLIAETLSQNITNLEGRSTAEAGPAPNTDSTACAAGRDTIREDRELAKESSGDVDIEFSGLVPTAMETEHGGDGGGGGGEDISVGGEATYGSPGALVKLHSDLVLDKMFDSGPGEAEGTTGLWPLKNSPADTRHAAVLLSSTNSTRVLAIDGGGVFADVTDTLCVVSNTETLAAGNFGLESDSSWIAQVTPAGVRAFSLDGSLATCIDWTPPVNAIVSSGAVSQGIAIIQWMGRGQHSLVALCLSQDDHIHPSSGGGRSRQMVLKELGTLSLKREVSCISNVNLSLDKSTAIVVVGTYAPSLMILEISLSAAAAEAKGDAGDSATGWKVLGGVGLGSSLNQSSTSTPPSVPGAPWTPGSPLAAARFPQRDTAGAALPASVIAIAKPPPPFSQDEVDASGTPQKTEIRAESIVGGEALEDMCISSQKDTSPGQPLLADDYKATALELWVSTRNGEVNMLHVLPFPSDDSGRTQQAEHVQWGPSPTMQKRNIKHSCLPPMLCLLPRLPRAVPAFTALALSDRTSLLRCAPGGAAIEEMGLHLPGIVCSAPLILSTPSGGERLFLLAASEDGVLSLASLEAHQRSRVVTRPLPWHAELLATHIKVPGVAAIAGTKVVRIPPESDKMTFLPQVALVDEASGRITATISPTFFTEELVHGEKITDIALFPAQPWPEKDFQCFILATTALPPAAQGSPSRAVGGRLVLFGCPYLEGESHTLQLLEMVNFADPVTAVAVASNPLRHKNSNGSGSSSRGSIDTVPSNSIETSRSIPTTALPQEIDVFIAVGRRIVVFEHTRWTNSKPKGFRSFRKLAWAAANTPIDAIRVHQGKEITWVYTASQEGAIVYRYTLTSEPLDPGLIDEEWGPPHLELDSFTPVAHPIVDVGRIRTGALTLGVCGGLDIYVNKDPWTAMKPHSHLNLGDHGVGLVISTERDKAVLAITRGGGVAEVIDAMDHPEIKMHGFEIEKVLFKVQEAILKHPGFKLNPGAMEYLNLRIDPDTSRPVQQVLKHGMPREEPEKVPEGPETATAEGPSQPAVVIEQPALQHLLNQETPRPLETKTDPGSIGMLYGEVLKLFLEAPCQVQHEIIAMADTGDEWLSGESIEAKAARLAFALSNMGVHLL